MFSFSFFVFCFDVSRLVSRLASSCQQTRANATDAPSFGLALAFIHLRPRDIWHPAQTRETLATINQNHHCTRNAAESGSPPEMGGRIFHVFGKSIWEGM